MATSGPLGGAKIGPHDPPGKKSGPDPAIIYRVRGSRLDSYAFSIPQHAENIPSPLTLRLWRKNRHPANAKKDVMIGSRKKDKKNLQGRDSTYRILVAKDRAYLTTSRVPFSVRSCSITMQACLEGKVERTITFHIFWVRAFGNRVCQLCQESCS
ncbi:hypothetical protein NPIL_568481 [Nephila pilipes]|uniref:Uncharacterized protein n=1 Tax=Nephila pilipes TaxID=299642 RepID=A0A8X6QE60_NEPPI|nr:hypothetical protein NPIL_568481 [Nephila pilipes]